MNELSFDEHIYFMKIAMEEAEQAFKLDEVPVGAVIVSGDGQLLGQAHNIKESSHDPTGHAELLAIKLAALKLKNWRLSDCYVFVTLEPCPMCMSALQQARIGKLVFGAYDLKGGAISKGFNLHQNPALNHSFQVTGGLLHFQSSRLLSTFFKQRRGAYKSQSFSS